MKTTSRTRTKLFGVFSVIVAVAFLPACNGSSSGGGGGGGGASQASILLANASTLDLNADGLLSPTEATDDGTPGGTPLETTVFDALDLDSDGFLDLDELIGTPADVLNGGAMYDKWWVVAGLPAPVTDHPIWATQSSNTRSGGDTWRCKECHGWDYKGALGAYSSGSHFTGFAGIAPLVTDSTGFDVFARVKTDHGFGAAGLTDIEIGDLVDFVMAGTIDTDTIIDGLGAFIGVAATGAPLYTACSACHASDGLMMPPLGSTNDYFDDYPGAVSTVNPWEFQHKVSYGQPGTAMPPQAASLTTAELGHIGVYAQTLPALLPLPGGTPDVLVGGQLYDKWWVVTGATPPTTDHPEWAAQSTNLRTGSDTWRCKECHGWDYIGDLGRYGTGSHFTGFAGLFPPAASTDQEVYNKIWVDHQYGNKLADADILDLVEFVQTGQLDITAILASVSGPFIGSAANGSTLFSGTAACSTCHGADGTLVPPVGSSDTGFTNIPGFLSSDNPEEFQHKVSYGHPGSIMPGKALALTVTELGDLGVHSQTLPTVP